MCCSSVSVDFSALRYWVRHAWLLELARGSGFLCPGQYLVLGTCYLVLVPGARYPVPNSWYRLYLVLDSRYLGTSVHSAM